MVPPYQRRFLALIENCAAKGAVAEGAREPFSIVFRRAKRHSCRIARNDLPPNPILST